MKVTTKSMVLSRKFIAINEVSVLRQSRQAASLQVFSNGKKVFD